MLLKKLKSVEKISNIENVDDDKIKELEQQFFKVAKNVLNILPKNDIEESFEILWPFRKITKNALRLVEQEQEQEQEKIKKNTDKVFQSHKYIFNKSWHIEEKPSIL